MCSTPAGECSFGKKAVADGKVRFIKNGIETDRFKFDEKTRREVREELGVGISQHPHALSDKDLIHDII